MYRIFGLKIKKKTKKLYFVSCHQLKYYNTILNEALLPKYYVCNCVLNLMNFVLHTVRGIILYTQIGSA